MIDFCDGDAMRHKKKKDQKSKSSKRSDHKHQYEKIIIRGFIGWQWAERCTICGRIKTKFCVSDREFIKPEYRQLPYVSWQTYYSQEELEELYPDVEIIDASLWDLD